MCKDVWWWWCSPKVEYALDSIGGGGGGGRCVRLVGSFERRGEQCVVLVALELDKVHAASLLVQVVLDEDAECPVGKQAAIADLLVGDRTGAVRLQVARDRRTLVGEAVLGYHRILHDLVGEQAVELLGRSHFKVQHLLLLIVSQSIILVQNQERGNNERNAVCAHVYEWRRTRPLGARRRQEKVTENDSSFCCPLLLEGGFCFLFADCVLCY